MRACFSESFHRDLGIARYLSSSLACKRPGHFIIFYILNLYKNKKKVRFRFVYTNLHEPTRHGDLSELLASIREVRSSYKQCTQDDTVRLVETRIEDLEAGNDTIIKRYP